MLLCAQRFRFSGVRILPPLCKCKPLISFVRQHHHHHIIGASLPCRRRSLTTSTFLSPFCFLVSANWTPPLLSGPALFTPLAALLSTPSFSTNTTTLSATAQSDFTPSLRSSIHLVLPSAESLAAPSCSSRRYFHSNPLRVERVFEADRFSLLRLQGFIFDGLKKRWLAALNRREHLTLERSRLRALFQKCRLQHHRPLSLPLLGLLGLRHLADHRARARSPNNRKIRSGKGLHRNNSSRLKTSSLETQHLRPPSGNV